ncbi:hypothetical protein EWM64_g10964 [Hericium alpestre]|uniref:Uncharacterized protein n=1 Tax=Hericium alpestre TaxID=135208 RepID=A0A4Y9ZGZ2_9AGAM|nr:hypothetical protein EWM64_g10964 [Hericium alpestre]
MSSPDAFIADVKRKLELASTIDAQELRDKYEREEAARYAADDDDDDEEDEDEELEDEDGEEDEDGDGSSNGEDEDGVVEDEKTVEEVDADEDEAIADDNNSDGETAPEKKQAWEPRDGVHEQLSRCVALVQSIEQEKEQGRLSDDQFTELIDFAGGRINALFDQYYSEDDFADIEVKLFAAENAVKIKHQFYIMTTKSFQSFVSMLGKFMVKEMTIEDAWDSKVLARPWLTTSRPSPQSNLLARFSPDYDHDKFDAIYDSIEYPAQRDKVEALFQARSSFFDESIMAPHCMAIGENVLVIGAAGGYKRREDRLLFRPIGSEPVETNQWDFDIIKSIRTGMAQPGSQVVYDYATRLVWHDGDHRIKAFGLNRKVKYTLDSSDYQGQFAVIDNGTTVIRGGKEDFAAWKIDQLTEHAKGVVPGGRLIPEDDEETFGWLEEGASRSMERSSATRPSRNSRSAASRLPSSATRR